MNPQTQKIYSQFINTPPTYGNIKKIAKEIKIDHSLALELWSTKNYFARMLAVLIMDKN